VFEQQTGRQRRGESEEHIREDGREQRRAADAGRVPEGLPPGRGTVKDARSLIPTPPHFRTSRRRATVMTPRFSHDSLRTQLVGGNKPPDSTHHHTQHVPTMLFIDSVTPLSRRFDEKPGPPPRGREVPRDAG